MGQGTMVRGFNAGDCIAFTTGSSLYYVLWLDVAIRGLVFVVRLTKDGQARRGNQKGIPFNHGAIVNFLGAGSVKDTVLNLHFVTPGQLVAFAEPGNEERSFTSAVERVKVLSPTNAVDRELVHSFWIRAVSLASIILADTIIDTYLDILGIARETVVGNFRKRLARDDFLRLLDIVGLSIQKGTFEQLLRKLKFLWNQYFELTRSNTSMEPCWTTLETAAEIFFDTVHG